MDPYRQDSVKLITTVESRYRLRKSQNSYSEKQILSDSYIAWDQLCQIRYIYILMNLSDKLFHYIIPRKL